MEHAVNNNEVISYLEVNAAVIGPEAIKGFPIAHDFAEVLVLLILIEFDKV